ncbi:DUF3870 domain-containing protein [Salinicoccus albus]|uniref:DUF3870 domain-containing protein n=1 Tax=Salinicoccus albus TaxID=418756 RepID=UPI00037F08D2|nr:DUF3870 domain-containing protein [Salinicoccus albus]
MTLEKLNTILVTAYAKAPQGSSMYEIYKHAGIVLEIDTTSHEIVDAEFTFITNLAQNFFQKLIIGYDISVDLTPLIKRIEQHYLAPSSDSVIVALKSAQKRYMEKTNSK